MSNSRWVHGPPRTTDLTILYTDITPNLLTPCIRCSPFGDGLDPSQLLEGEARPNAVASYPAYGLYTQLKRSVKGCRLWGQDLVKSPARIVGLLPLLLQQLIDHTWMNLINVHRFMELISDLRGYIISEMDGFLSHCILTTNTQNFLNTCRDGIVHWCWCLWTPMLLRHNFVYSPWPNPGVNSYLTLNMICCLKSHLLLLGSFSGNILKYSWIEMCAKKLCLQGNFKSGP